MSPRGPDLAVRVSALDEAIAAAHGRLDATHLDRARRAVVHIRERLELSPEHTVAALAGSTGSGKSSLLNALTGQTIAEVGIRRPTTGHPVGAIWGPDGAAALLDWIGVDERRYLAREAGMPEGLVLLDLPDHDSVVTDHRLRAERLLERVDLFVWVTDPQKYADAALHERYLRPLAGHCAVVVLVLNQVDRLTPAERDTCVADLLRLAAADGLRRVRVLPVSATTGEGIDTLRGLLVQAAQRRAAATARLTADVRAEATLLADACGDGMPTGARRAARATLVNALEDAAGVGVVVEAVRASTAQRARAATGWPPTRWLLRVRADPLRRLHLDVPTPHPELVRTSLTAPGPAARARASLAVRTYTDAATAGAPEAWVLAARARAAEADLPDALDQAVAGTPLDADRRPAWWRVVGILQWALLAALVTGLGWLSVLAALAYVGLPEPATPAWSGFPLPTLLLIGGALAGVLVAAVSRLVGAVAAQRRAGRARSRLRTAVAQVADERLVRPVDQEMGALDRCRAAARMAAA